MNILLIHYRFSIIGGPERYMFNIIKELEKRGNNVYVFSINWNDNEYSEYSAYWPTIHTTKGEFTYKTDLKSINGIYQTTKLLLDSVYNFSIKKSIDNFLDKFLIDVAYVLKFIGKLTPSILVSLKSHNIPIVHRISDFAMLCNNGSLHDWNGICDKCRYTFFFGFLKKCNRSVLLSLGYYIVNSTFISFKFHKYIDVYIIPSKFSKNEYLTRSVFKHSNILVLPTFVNGASDIIDSLCIKKRYDSNILIYWGRVSQEKGTLELIEYFYNFHKTNSKYLLKIVGIRNDSYSTKVKDLVESLKLNKIVELIPFFTKINTFELSLNSKAFVFTSLIYDNLPQCIIESLSLSLPVIACDLGSIKELVIDNYNGFTCTPNNENSFSDALTRLNNLTFEKYSKMANNSFIHFNKYFDKNEHCSKLIDVFQSLINPNQ